MRKKDIKIRINEIIWKKSLEKIESDFGRKYCKTDSMMIIMLLALYKRKSILRNSDNIYLAVQRSEQLDSSNYTFITIAVYDGLLELLQKLHPALPYSQLIESAIADYLVLPRSFYTECISPLYTIVGSKNHTMQEATATIVDEMNLYHESLTLIDGCCATGSLFFGLKDYPWKTVILNDLNPLRTNFLNVLKKEPLKLIKKILENDLSFIKQPETKNPKLSEFKKMLNTYETKRKNYHKIDCNIDIAYTMFITQCIDKAHIEQSIEIIGRILRFLPACMKLQKAIITQQDCLTYLQNDTTNKLVLLDTPYIGSEATCGIKGYDYEKFHKKVASFLNNVQYPFMYYCRITPPKSEKVLSPKDAENVMKMKLENYFSDLNCCRHTVNLLNGTELILYKTIL